MKETPLPRPELAPAILDWRTGRRERALIAEVHGSSAALLLAALRTQNDTPLAVVCGKDDQATQCALDLAMFDPDAQVARLPESTVFDADSAEGRRARSEREAVLEALRARRGEIVIGSVHAWLERCGDPTIAELARRTLRPRERIDFETLRRELFEAGLEPKPLVTAPGEMSLRGDIVDFFAFGSAAPIRIELFDDEIESVRTFDPASQRSAETLERVTLPPAAGRRSVRQGTGVHTAADHFARPWQWVRIDPLGVLAAQKSAAELGSARAEETLSGAAELLHKPGLDLAPLWAKNADQTLGAAPLLGAAGVEDLGRFGRALDPAVTHLHVYASTPAEGARVARLLRQCLPSSPRRSVHVHRGSLATGFVMPALHLWAGNPHELLSRTRLRRAEAESKVVTRAVEETLELTPGDFVVHLTHGIGLFRGVRQHQTDGGTEDYLVLEFAEETLLWVPASKIDLLSRYVGAGGSAPKLDKIGGSSWSRKKASVESALEEVAEDLLELQAKRRTRPGFAFAPDDEMQEEFEASFPYTETGDQWTALAEIKRDLEAPRPMDRLLCGDVGFGKTELAVRAAFKVASQGKQVAVLAPTTLLVRQHFETFRNRMAEWPIRLASLSRMQSGAQFTAITRALEQGSLDIVIGTHRILSQEVRFKDLGLVVIDEEQRFGVRHKESLKLLRSEVDVLTLSATPIPRTLHMALVGLREISTLRTPPRGRQSVDTIVTYEDDEVVSSAIERELEREGQVFYLYNRVGPIEARARALRELVPRARIAVAHGQMRPSELERAAQAFEKGSVDVLVCTNIIESGIDIPRANTLIVERSDLLGLSDLHQLRGRIGRSDRKAYAYFLLPHKPLPSAARKRLRALQGLSHLGAGFDLSIRDLEIRGAGNLLGARQSGHIEAVGYDLYCRLLAKAVARRKGRKLPAEPEEIDIGLGLPAFLPREYVKSTHQRMGLLRKLGAASSDAELAELAEELRDRFGRVPAPARNLLELLRLKLRCRFYGVARIFYPGGGEMLLNVRDFPRFARAPLTEQEARWVEGSRVLLLLPPKAHDSSGALSWLQDKLDPARAVRKPGRTANQNVPHDPAPVDSET